MNKLLLGAFLGLILIGCSKDEKIEQPAVDVKSQYQENIQKKVDLAKSEINIPESMGSPEIALCAAASMKIGQGIGVYRVWVNALDERYTKIYPSKSKEEIEAYISERIDDKLQKLRRDGLDTQVAFSKFYNLNCKN